MGNGNELAPNLPPLAGTSSTKTSKSKRTKLLGTRRGSILLAVLAGIAALVVIGVFVSQYKSSVDAGVKDIDVLVADQNLEVGTSGDVLAEAQLFKPQSITEDDAVEGAITDPSALVGARLNTTVAEGQQLSESMFTQGSDPVTGKIEGVQRAITIPVGTAPGSIGVIKAGSTVDVLAVDSNQDATGVTLPDAQVLARDITVLRVPEESSGGVASGEEDAMAVLRVTDVEGAKIAGATALNDIWLLVRPPTLAEDSTSSNNAGGA